MRLRIAFLTLTVLFALSSALVVPLLAQDPPPDSGMDSPVGTPQPLPTRAAFSNPQRIVPLSAGTRLELFFAPLLQGQTGLARVFKTEEAGAAISAVRADFLGDDIPFFQTDADYFYGLLAAPMESPTGRDVPLALEVTYADGTVTPFALTVEIGFGPYFRQRVNLPLERAFLLDSDTERAELARLEAMFAPITPERMWESVGFRLPIQADLTSAFGLFRTFNGTINTRHTGWDIRTIVGVPVAAVASGHVIYAGDLDIRGSYVAVDHGFGVYSGYAHLSQIDVAVGDSVAWGETLGLTGATGRVSGAHFHWEMAVNGDFVDGVQLLQMWMP
jgi:murein DD-endopeptidase MepM/ murein hydrolase activator NlpD